MSLNTPAPAAHPAGTPELPRHVVTAVLVAHDGARWLPKTLAGLLAQDRPVQDVIAADTGSADDSARLLAESLGDQRVLHLARRTGFGAAVEEAARTAAPLTADQLPYLTRRSGWDPVSRSWNDDAYDEPDQPHGDPVQWLWLLHDDCEPDPGALAGLLRLADTSPSAAVIGPKLRSWYDRRQLLEVGVSIARSGRRWTALERREQDQGQHDQVRPVLAVSSAGMLVRRDVWEELGGFDRRLPLMRDDVDFCWRAQAAGHGVLVAPDAVMWHAEAASRERRPVDCAGRSAVNPHRVDKAGAVYTLLANTRGPLLPYVMLRIAVGTVLRTLAYLVGKVPGQAVDELVGLLGVLLRPGRLLSARSRRGRGAVPPSELRPLFPPPGATVRATVDQVVSNLAGRADAATAAAGRHGGAVESGPGDDDGGDYLEVEQFARLKRIARKPGPVLFAVLLVFSLAACRSLLGGGSLAGGALLPAEPGASDLWGSWAGSWHALGTGGTQSAPPYLAVLGLFSTVLFGSTGLTLTLLLVASVPLAGVAAYFASRPLVESRLLRAWASVAYAFLPATTGALATGRLGTAVLAILLPLMARAAVSAAGLQLGDAALDRGARPGWRATWALALMLTFTTAFTPVTWPIALVLAAATLAWRTATGRRQLLVPHLLRFAALIVTPIVLLAPWSLTLLTHPGRLLQEAGLPYGTESASGLDLALLSPGGPKGSGGLLLTGLVLAALAAMLRDSRRTATTAAWAVAVTGLLFAVIENGKAWAGPATLVYGIALLAAAAVGAEGARERITASGFGWRQPVAGLIAVAAVAAPLLAAFTWVADGADGPLDRRNPQQVPAFVAEESKSGDQARTLVLNGTAGHVSYALVRGSGARLGDAELTAEAPRDTALDTVVANLVAGSGADQGSRLAGYAVRYVLAQKGTPRTMGRVLDSTPGLSRVSQADGSELWRVDETVSRITITSKGAEAVAVPSGHVEAHTKVPAGPQGRVLRLADSASGGWHATLDGTALTPTEVDGWAQGFELPAAGGRLDVSFKEPVAHVGWLGAQAFLLLVAIVLALPGRRREVDDDLPEEDGAPAAAEIPAQASGEGRRARRLQAAADAEAAAAGPPAPDAREAGGGASDDEPAQPPQNPYEPAGAPYDPAEGGYDPYAVQPADGGAEPYYAPYQDQQWEQQPYPAEQGGPYEQQQGGYGDGYGYVPQQPVYDPYAPQEQEQVPHDGTVSGYGDQAPYGEQGGYPDPAAYAEPDPAAYYADGDQRRDGSDHQ